MVRKDATGIPSPKIIGKKEYGRRHAQKRRIEKHDHILKLQRAWRKKNRKKHREYHRKYYHDKLRDKYMKDKLDGILKDIKDKKIPPETLNIIMDFLEYQTWQNVREIKKLKERMKKMQTLNNNRNSIISRILGDKNA